MNIKKTIIKNEKELIEKLDIEQLSARIQQSRSGSRIGDNELEFSNKETGQLDDSVALKIKERLDKFKDDLELKKMDTIEQSEKVFDYEGVDTELKSVIVDTIENQSINSVAPHPPLESTVINSENLKLFKDNFVVDKLVENLKNGKGLNKEFLTEIEERYNLKVDLAEDDEPLFRVDGNKLKINLNLDRGREFLGTGVDFIKNLTLDEITVSGSVIPTISFYMFYRRISSLYAKHLDQTLNRFSGNARLMQARINNQSLLIFNIFAGITTAIVFSGGVQAIKNTASAKININPNLVSGEATDPNSNIIRSFIPLFIFNKFPNWARFICLYIFMICCIYFIKLNYSSLSDYFNHTYLFVFVSLFLLYILYFILKLLIIIYYINYKENLLENKTYKYLPSSLKKSIAIFRDLDKDTKKILINQNLKLLTVNIFLLGLGLILLNFITFVLF